MARACIEQRTLCVEHVEEREAAKTETTCGRFHGSLSRRQNPVAYLLDVRTCGAPVAQGLLDLRTHTQLGRIAKITRLFRPPCGRQNIALVTIKQRQRNREADEVDAFTLDLVVLATDTDAYVRVALAAFKPQLGFTQGHLAQSSTHIGTLTHARQECRFARHLWQVFETA